MGAEVPVASHVSPHPHPQTVSKNLKDSFVPQASLARVLPLSLSRGKPLLPYARPKAQWTVVEDGQKDGILQVGRAIPS